MDRIAARATAPIDVPRFGEPVLVRPRLGQGSFRIGVTDVYQRRCAVTGERTLPILAACRTRVLDGRFWRAETSCGVGSVPSAVQRRDLGRFGRLLCWRGDAWRPGQAGARTNIRFRFHAIVTRLHSPRTLSRPRNENWRNPSADLMMPNTGSGVCLRKA